MAANNSFTSPSLPVSPSLSLPPLLPLKSRVSTLEEMISEVLSKLGQVQDTYEVSSNTLHY